MQRSSLSFISTMPSLRGWRFFLLAASIALLAVTAVRWNTQKKAIASLEARLVQAAPRIVTQPARTASEQRQLDMQLKAVAEAVRQLNMPIAELIKVLQAPKDIRVVLLSLDVSGTSASGENDGNAAGTLKIGAEAKTAQEMTTYVAFLADQRLFKSVYLVKHEVSNTSPEKPYRFQLEAQWRD